MEKHKPRLCTGISGPQPTNFSYGASQEAIVTDTEGQL